MLKCDDHVKKNIVLVLFCFSHKWTRLASKMFTGNPEKGILGKSLGHSQIIIVNQYI